MGREQQAVTHLAAELRSAEQRHASDVRLAWEAQQSAQVNPNHPSHLPLTLRAAERAGGDRAPPGPPLRGASLARNPCADLARAVAPVYCVPSPLEGDTGRRHARAACASWLIWGHSEGCGWGVRVRVGGGGF